MNFLDNGAVLPFGLLQCDPNIAMRGFNKTYKNTALRMGIVMNTYPVGDPKNVTALTTEYDVVVNEQNENDGVTPVTYKNCITSDGFGSITDFFEKTFRSQNKDSVKGNVANTKGQNGATVLILCLDGMSEKGVIIGGINHPDRKTTLVDKLPHLEGEYNGAHIVVNSDGSTTFTFKGATDNDGKIIDPTQGNTVVTVEKDGSYQVSHKTITQRFDKGGDVTLTADGNITNNATKNFNVNSTENTVINATKKVNITAQEMLASISGSAALQCQSGTVDSQSTYGIKASVFTAEAEGLVQIKAPTVIIDSPVVALGGVGGLPVLTLGTTIFSIGNLGLPTLGRAIAGFSFKVTAQ